MSPFCPGCDCGDGCFSAVRVCYRFQIHPTCASEIHYIDFVRVVVSEGSDTSLGMLEPFCCIFWQL